MRLVRLLLTAADPPAAQTTHNSCADVFNSTQNALVVRLVCVLIMLLLAVVFIFIWISTDQLLVFLLVGWSNIVVLIIWLRPVVILSHPWLWFARKAWKFVCCHRISLLLYHLGDQSLVGFIFVLHHLILIRIVWRWDKTRELLRRLTEWG